MGFHRRPSEARFGDLHRYLFDLQGYLLFEHVLDATRVAHLRRVIDSQHLPPAGMDIMSQRFGSGGQLFGWDQALADLLDHPLAVAILRDVVGSHVRIDHAYGIVMAPGTSGLGLHGPAEPFDPAQYYVHRMGVARSGLISLSWSLSDGGPGQGGFGCIPGSHRASMALPAGAEALVVEVPQPAGSLLVFTEALAHQSLPWYGTDTRWVLMYKYSPGSSSWEPRPAAPPDIVGAMSEQQRRFFQPPSVGGRVPTFDD